METRTKTIGVITKVDQVALSWQMLDSSHTFNQSFVIITLSSYTNSGSLFFMFDLNF